MKHAVRRFKSLRVALKELEPFIRAATPLQSGRPFKNFGDMRPREALVNWLICAAYNAQGAEQLSFTSDPTGGDGILHHATSDRTWLTEHVMVPPAPQGEKSDIQALILKAVESKIQKGGSAYASGKTLMVFLEAGGDAEWFPNRVAKALPNTDFAGVWVVGLHHVEGGEYIYGVAQLDVSGGDAPTWAVHISRDFETWKVTRLQ